MRHVLARCVLGLVSSLAALSLSCGSGDSEGLFTTPSFAGAAGVSGSSGVAGAHASAGSGGASLSGSTGSSAGTGGSGKGGSPGQAGDSGRAGDSARAGSPGAGNHSGGSAGSAAGSAGQPAGGASGSTGGGGASAGSAGNGGTGGSAGSGGATCLDNLACADSEYCAKPSCAAKSEGRCAARPTDCNNTKQAVLCGCDGLTYHDGCLLHANGQNSAASGGCLKADANTLTCTFLDDSACTNAGAECALKAEACANVGANELGICWVLPVTCPGSDDQTVESCSEQNHPACLSECAAIQAKQRYSAAGNCH